MYISRLRSQAATRPVTMSKQISRRHFAKQTSASIVLSATWTAKSYAKIVGANDRIRVGLIGAGGMGIGHARCIKELQATNNLELVNVVDCWRTRAEHAAEIVGASSIYTDYRRSLDEHIDYVTIATPEHWHQAMTCDALDAGKAVYCEKPMAHSVEEGLAVLHRQQQTGLPVQIGVQSSSDDIYRRAGTAIRNGVLGKVVQAQTEYVRRHDTQGPWRQPEAVAKHRTKPIDLDWKAWQGSAPRQEWNPHHYFEWRNYSRYSGGIATDLFIHRLTRLLIACDLQFPRRVVGMGGIRQWKDGRDLPDNFEMICDYPRGMTVYVLGTQSNRVGVDHLIRGYRATMQFEGNKWIARNKDGEVLAEESGDVSESIHKHHTNLHNHLRHGEELNCPVDLGMWGLAAVCMANKSWACGQVMAWDATRMCMISADGLEKKTLETKHNDCQ